MTYVELCGMYCDNKYSWEMKVQLLTMNLKKIIKFLIDLGFQVRLEFWKFLKRHHTKCTVNTDDMHQW